MSSPVSMRRSRDPARWLATPASWRAVAFKPESGIKFDYEISMGVRFGENEWKETLDAWIAGHRGEIDQILMSYRIPLIDDKGNLIEAARSTQETP